MATGEVDLQEDRTKEVEYGEWMTVVRRRNKNPKKVRESREVILPSPEGSWRYGKVLVDERNFEGKMVAATRGNRKFQTDKGLEVGGIEATSSAGPSRLVGGTSQQLVQGQKRPRLDEDIEARNQGIDHTKNGEGNIGVDGGTQSVLLLTNGDDGGDQTNQSEQGDSKERENWADAVDVSMQ